jgi:hypothetical protein
MAGLPNLRLPRLDTRDKPVTNNETWYEMESSGIQVLENTGLPTLKMANLPRCYAARTENGDAGERAGACRVTEKE